MAVINRDFLRRRIGISGARKRRAVLKLLFNYLQTSLIYIRITGQRWITAF
jgi:hypothetical protein